MRGLKRSHAYEKLVAAIKRRDIGGALALVIGDPTLVGRLWASVEDRRRNRAAVSTTVTSPAGPLSLRLGTTFSDSDPIVTREVPAYAPSSETNWELPSQRSVWGELANLGSGMDLKIICDDEAGAYAAGFIPADRIEIIRTSSCAKRAAGRRGSARPMSAYRASRSLMIPVDIAAILTFIALSALILNTIFGSLSALMFLGCGCLLIVSNIHHSVYMFTRWWFLLLLPAYCMLSTLWSQFPENTFRYSAQLMLTLAIGVVIAGRVTTPTLLKSLFIVYGIGVIASLLFGYIPSGAAWLGIFGSKNAFAAHIAVFSLASVAVLVDARSPFLLRIAALGGALISGPLLVMAQSAGAILMVVPCVAIIVLVMLTNRLTGMQKVFLAACVVLILAVIGLLIAGDGQALLADILDSSGKDPSLTGRTDLWATGFSFIAERPLQGVGYRAFWVPGFAPAEQLWAMFDVPSGAGFNFHNTYISNAVEIGLIGLLLQIAIIYGGGLLIGIYALMRPNAQNAFLLAMQVLVILRSFIEVEVFFEFSVRSILTVCTFIYAAHGLNVLLQQAPSPARAPQPAVPGKLALGVEQ